MLIVRQPLKAGAAHAGAADSLDRVDGPNRLRSSPDDLQPVALLVFVETAGLGKTSEFVARIDALEATDLRGDFKFEIVCADSILSPPAVAGHGRLGTRRKLYGALKTARKIDLVTRATVLRADGHWDVAPETD